ncbi:MAG: RsmF rRNA methyltransferase first C-terminal domain-containing protein [Clostridia bacterium]|nr:RsmF rRNA methyltransferase first C-terminal domain-containing protein [Clostridia bacterium]
MDRSGNPSVYPLPDLFVRRIREQFPAEADSLLRMLDETPQGRALRINTLRTSSLPPDNLHAFLQCISSVCQDPVPWFPDGRYVPADYKPGQELYHAAGAYYMQEASAMAPAALLDPQPGDRILDLCAAPGGKSGQIAQRMQGQGILVSNEIVPKRARILEENLYRLGVPNSIITCEPAQRLAAHFPLWFDRVLVDAPCSGEGMFRMHPEGRKEWEKSPPAFCAQRQQDILSCAARTVRGGGVLVYSTCTFSREENEQTVEAFLAAHPDFSLDSTASLPGIPGKGMLRLIPGSVRGEGQFAVRFLRKETKHTVLPLLETVSSPVWSGFLKDHFFPVFPESEQVCFFGDSCYLPMKQCPDLTGLHVLSLGIPLGTIRNGRLLPAHELFMSSALLPFRHRIHLTLEQARTFLRGETLPLPGSGKGFVQLLYGGFPLGGGKLADGRIQNHLPKGLRLPSAYLAIQKEM